jgi:transcription initiation factor TFIID subunit 7
MASKPHITLKIGGASSQARSPAVANGATGTPTSTGTPTFKLKLGGASKPSTPNESSPKKISTPTTTKAGRAPKPSLKLAANKNLKRKDGSDDDEAPVSVARRSVAEISRPTKKLKMSISRKNTDATILARDAVKTPTVLKAKFKGKPPKRPAGEGYDSEASDREEDPMIEEEFILRMLPGDDCDYVRRMIEEKKIGIPRREGGADIQMKFLHPEGRRAAVTVRGRHYAATLVDLPCIIEGMKSWDKKGWYKTADICQMLLVFAPIRDEKEALEIELPKAVDPQTWQYPHGITPPMHNARKRRFRKRISRNAIEAVEAAVEKLLADDAKADSSRYEILDPEAQSGGEQYSEDEEEDDGYDEEEDAEGEADDDGYFNGHHDHMPTAEEADDGGADLEAELEAAFLDEVDFGTPASPAVVDSPDEALTAAGTPDAGEDLFGDDGSGAESGDGAEDDDEDDGDEEEVEIDEDERARLAELEAVREDIAEMQRQLVGLEAQMATQANPILKRRIKDNIDKVKAELQLKKSSIGEDE